MFREPWLLLLGAALTAAAALAHWAAAARRRRLSAKLGDLATLERLLDGAAPRRRRIQAWLRGGALFLLGVALAGPQWGVELAETSSRARDVMIAVDVSQSMLAEDVPPNRLARAKEELSLLIDELKGARVGVIAFAGEPLLVCPLTHDAAAAKQLLRALEPSMVPVPGTGVGKAVRRAVRALSRYPGASSVVVLTDGEDHKTDPRGAAEEASAEGVRVFAIGIGSAEGQPIPLKDANGQLLGYKKDKRGATVVSRLGEAELSAMALAAGGAYYRSTPGAAEATEIARAILGTGPDAEAKLGTTRRYRNRYLIPLFLAFLLLLLEWLVPETAAPATPASRAAAMILAALCLAPSAAGAATAEGTLRRGNRHYERGEYERALEQYGAAARRSPRDRRPVFNAGDALFKLEQYDKAAEAFNAVAESGGPADVLSSAYYNLGNALYAKGDYAGAIGAYRRAIVSEPRDEEARRNLAVALRRLKNPPPPQKQPKKDDQKKKDEKKDKNDQDKDKGGGGGQPPPQQQQQPKSRPQDQISKEDAERILRAVKERERAQPKQLQKNAGERKPQTEEDW